MEKLRYLVLRGGFPYPVEIDRSDGAALPSGLVYLSLSRVKVSDVSFNHRNQKPTTVLSLSKRDKVRTVPAPLGNLAALEHVQIDDCRSALGLHSGTFGCLPRLKRLTILLCSELLKLPEALGNSQALEQLEIEECEDLLMLPDIKPGCLQKLRKLTISRCHRLQQLPGTFLELQGLEHLRLQDVSFWTIPDFKKLRSLKTLELSFSGLATLSPWQTLERSFSGVATLLTPPKWLSGDGWLGGGAILPTLPQWLGEAISDSNSENLFGKAHVFNVVEGKFLYQRKSRVDHWPF